MEISNNFKTSLHIVLKNLIDEKSKRDQVVFTAYQLANALNIPRSVITKLTHPNRSKRVTNPRIDTLLKIVDFFRSDGFNITVEDLLGIQSTTIDIDTKTAETQSYLRTIPVYSLENKKNKQLGTIELKLSSPSKDVFALHANRDIKPFFKTGSIFIVDRSIAPENNTLIAIKLGTSETILIRKYHIEKNKIILRSLSQDEKDIILMPTTQCEIIGVVIQINART